MTEPAVPLSVVKSADRTVDILELLAARPGGLTLAEIHRELGVPKSSLHGLLQTLLGRGWLQTDDRATSFMIGIRSLRIGAAYLDRDPMVEASGPVLTQLRNDLNETVHLARLDGCDVVYLSSRESAHHLRTSSRIGRRLPAYTTALGKVLLAARTDEEALALLPERLVSLTANTTTNRDELLAELNEARTRGYSFEEGQNTPGLGCFAVAIPGPHPPVDSISCSAPLVRLTDEHVLEIISRLTHAADYLGHRGR